jgi:hypothetical protein
MLSSSSLESHHALINRCVHLYENAILSIGCIALQVGATPVYGVGQPSTGGVRAVLERLGARRRRVVRAML